MSRKIIVLSVLALGLSGVAASAQAPAGAIGGGGGGFFGGSGGVPLSASAQLRQAEGRRKLVAQDYERAKAQVEAGTATAETRDSLQAEIDSLDVQIAALEV